MAQTKNIDIIPNNAIKRVHVSQGDIGRTIYFNLYEGSLAYTPTSGDVITCVGTKPSGLGFTVTCTWSGNVVTCVTTEAMTDESGSIETELVITSSDESTVLGTSNFVLVVEKNPHPSDTTDGTQITAQSLQVQIDELAESVETDTTLSISGKPADAKAVGDAISDLESELSDIDDALAPVYTEGQTLTPTTNNGWYISATVQLNAQNNQDFKVSTVPVEAGKRYRIRGTTRLQAEYPLVAFGNTNVMSVGAQGTRIILGSTTATTYDQYYDATENGYLWIASYSTREILSVTEYTKEYTNLPKRMTLKVQLFGDSITDNTWGDLTTWVNYMSDYMPVYDLTIVNSAIGGSRLSKSTSTTNAVENLIEDGTTVQTDADLIVIWAGTNDWAGGGPELGTFLGTYGIYGAVKNIIQTLSTNAPNSLIFFATPLQRYNTTDQSRETDANGTPLNTRGYTLRQFCDAIVETCEYYGIPCIDMNGTSGINRINVTSFTTDGLHPNANGDKRIAHIMCKRINALFGVSY